MRVLAWFIVATWWVVISFPGASDAFSRRTSQSEVSHITPLTGHESRANTNQQTLPDLSAQAVPEPPVHWLVGLGIGLLAVGVMLKRPRGAVFLQNERSGGHGQ